MRAVGRSAPFASGIGRQRGQALIYGLFVLIGGLASLLFFFNVGQLSREKTKLVNTADAVAYSAGLIHARALNFNAYSNRALIANEVLIAQMVSIASWAGYAESWAANLPLVHNECVQAANGNYWAGAASLLNFGSDYLVGCALLQQANQNGLVQPVTNLVRTAVGQTVPAIEGFKRLVLLSQEGINRVGATADRILVMTAVARANYQGDGVVSVDMLSPTLPDDWTRMTDGSNRVTSFVRQYPDNERTRFREVTMVATNTDPFIRQRSWTSQSLLPEPGCLSVFRWRQNEVRRRGGTELLGFDEWQAVDTQSFHENYLHRGKLIPIGECRQREIPTGVGGEESFRAGQNQDPGTAPFGDSRARNPSAHGQALSASTGSAMGYSGLPNYYDLNQIWLRDRPDAEPKLLHGVRLTRNRSDLRTTDGNTGQIRTQANSRIGAYDSAVAGDVMAAASASEVFFERPPATQPDNVYGAPLGRPRELGSLFNPYWQVRLASSNAVGEWVRQGVTP